MAIAALAAALAAVAPTADATPKAFLTIQIGRTQLGMAGPGCKLLPGSVGLADIAKNLHARGYSATGAVVVGYVGPSRYHCRGMLRYPGWDTLDTLKRRYGWSFVSAGMKYVDVRRMSRSEQRRQICGSLDVMRAHGHDNAWGLYAYPGDRSNDDVQRNVTATCFAYGRTYNHGLNSPSSLKPPWFQKTYSVDGGACNIRSLPCYRIITPVWPAHHLSPHALADLMAPEAGSWRVVQMYRFVKGTRREGKVQWDCTAPTGARTGRLASRSTAPATSSRRCGRYQAGCRSSVPPRSPAPGGGRRADIGLWNAVTGIPSSTRTPRRMTYGAADQVGHSRP